MADSNFNCSLNTKNCRSIISYVVLALFCAFLVYSYFQQDHDHDHQHPALAAGNPQAGASLSEEKVKEIVKDVIKSNPELILQSVENHYKEKMLAEKAAVKDKLTSLKSKIFANVADPKIGNGKIKVVQFFDYMCGYCKRSIAVHKKLVEDDSDIQIIFKEMPIMGPLSLVASKAALAVNMIDSSKYQAFQEALLINNLTDEDMIINLAGINGIDPIRLKETMDKPEIENMIQDNLSLANELQIKGTPAYVLEDEILPGAVNYNDLRSIINSKKGGEKAPITEEVHKSNNSNDNTAQSQ